MTGQFRRRPLSVEAVQYNGADCIPDLFDLGLSEVKFREVATETDSVWKLIIPTLEGEMLADIGDWIVRGVEGELYPCKPGVFKKIYEPII